MLGSAIAVRTALALSFRHQAALSITRLEQSRYWLKSANLALCYWGFACRRDATSANGAGRAAFYCCAYDVITDWRNYDADLYRWFRNLLKSELPHRSAEIALRLYEQERAGTLAIDGLSRGIDALEFISGLIGSEQYLRDHFDFEKVGIVMQIVDDVLDWEDDLRYNQTNCLLTSPSKRAEYLDMLLDFDLCHFNSTLPQARLLCRVIRSAQGQARQLKSSNSFRFEKAPSIEDHPHHNVNEEKHTEITCDVDH